MSGSVQDLSLPLPSFTKLAEGLHADPLGIQHQSVTASGHWRSWGQSASAVLCDFSIMLAGSFLGLGATAGGLLGSTASGGGLIGVPKLIVNGLTSGGLFGGSWVTGGFTEVLFVEALWRSCSKSTVAGLLLDITADAIRSLAVSGCGRGCGSSMKSDGGGIKSRFISDWLALETICSLPSASLDKHNSSGWEADGWISEPVTGSVTLGWITRSADVSRSFVLAAEAREDCGSEVSFRLSAFWSLPDSDLKLEMSTEQKDNYCS